ncbi:MAG: VCBS repeat-containing protein [Kiritimatiellaeota bacterium]|nr:VCBS repeat-containing protein [Kiritimatiellota bacterium]
MKRQLTTKGFEDFSKGTFGNGGQNLYVSCQGILQRIHQTDLTRNGYVDLVFCNSQKHEENTPVYLYPDPVHFSEKREELFIRGSACAEVADISGAGYDDLVIGCGWDGINLQLNAVILYGAEEGLTNKYLDFLPAPKSYAVAAGDFKGAGRTSLAFFSEGKIKVFYQGAKGFPFDVYATHDFSGAQQIAAIWDGKVRRHHLIIKKSDGSCFLIKASSSGLDFQGEHIKLCDQEPAGKGDEASLQTKNAGSALQTVKASESRIRVLTLKVKNSAEAQTYVFIAHKHKCFLYPYADFKLGVPLVFNCENAIAIASGDINKSGFIDLVFACRDTSTGKEASWIYYGDANGWSEKNRRALNTLNACDVALADFSGQGYQDIVICQGNTEESYTCQTLVFCTNAGGLSKEPIRLLAHNPVRALVVRAGKAGKPQLVVINRQSGSRIGNGDSFIYPGGPGGFTRANRIDLQSWGACDMVCCDVNDSGHPDLVFANTAELSPWLDPGSYIFKGSDKGYHYAPDIVLPTAQASRVITGDFNRDGFLDLAFICSNSPHVIVFYGSAKGFLPENSVKIKLEYKGKIYKELRGVFCADLNNDGWLDICIATFYENESFILWGGPKGYSFDNVQALEVHQACAINVADLNKDGYPDLIIGGFAHGCDAIQKTFVYIYWGSAEGYSENRKTLLPASTVVSLAIADFDNDGWLDIFVSSYQDGRTRDLDAFIYWNQKDKGFLPHKRKLLRVHAATGNVAADFNEDGWIDLAVANHKVNGDHLCDSTVWYNGPGGFDEKNTIDLPTEGVHSMGMVDVGNVMDRGPDEYYTSMPFELEAECGITSFECVADIPRKTWVKARFRLADSRYALEKMPWQGPVGPDNWFNIGERVDKTLFRGKWVQYRLAVGAYNSLNTPRISQITVNLETMQ